MLRRTFIHLPGIGPRREQALWRAGILDWDSALRAKLAPGFSAARWDEIRRLVDQSRRFLDAGDHAFFAEALPQPYHWRALHDFRGRVAYLDIETTGTGPWAQVTVVGVYDGVRTHSFIHGDNLDLFPEFIDHFAVIVTFNGSTFDLPFLRRRFPRLRFHQLHVDLRYALRQLGIRGTLKEIERCLGMRRPADLEGLTGEDAVRLWVEYCSGREKSLDLLLRYNAADVENLEPLAHYAYRQLWEKCDCADRCTDRAAIR